MRFLIYISLLPINKMYIIREHVHYISVYVFTSINYGGLFKIEAMRGFPRVKYVCVYANTQKKPYLPL